MNGGSKLDARGMECRLLGYTPGLGNYKVQDNTTHHVFVSQDVVFEEGQPHRTSASVGEHTIPVFDTNMNTGPLAETDPTPNNEYHDLAHHNHDPVHHIEVFTLPHRFLPESGGIKFGRGSCQIAIPGTNYSGGIKPFRN